jgi:hypothetical protein
MTVLSTEEQAIIDTVRQFVDRQVRPSPESLSTPTNIRATSSTR